MLDDVSWMLEKKNWKLDRMKMTVYHSTYKLTCILNV